MTNSIWSGVSDIAARDGIQTRPVQVVLAESTGKVSHRKIPPMPTQQQATRCADLG